MIQTSNPGEYNIGQQGRIAASVLRQHCNMPPYLRLVNKCKDEHGFITVQAVNTATRQADIGGLLGGVWIPLEAIIF